MASALARRTLARAAYKLNAQNGFAARLPALILTTDTLRLADPIAAARALPKGSAIILREPDDAKRARLAHALAAVARARSLVLLIANDPALAGLVRADGIHLPEARASHAHHWRARRPDWLITVAAHGARSVSRAAMCGADAAILAPVFATLSHPERIAQGPLRLAAIARASALPVYALGGIDARNAGRLIGMKLAGLAAIGGLDTAG